MNVTGVQTFVTQISLYVQTHLEDTTAPAKMASPMLMGMVHYVKTRMNAGTRISPVHHKLRVPTNLDLSSVPV